MRAGSLELARYQRLLPSVQIGLTGSPAGRMIEEHFAIRERDNWRFRNAQGVLTLPENFATYMRGRHERAVHQATGSAAASS
jgi:hypothetical protein